MLQLLTAVAASPTPVSLTEAAARVGLVPSTALRQLRALEAAGMLHRSEDDQLYRPGPRLVDLARTVFVGQSLPAAAQPFLDHLATTTGESAYLAVAAGPRRAMYVATAPGPHALRHTGWLGRSFASASSAVGAALAGRVDDDGCVAREGVLEDGITAVSAPIRAGRSSSPPLSNIVAAFSVVGPTFRIDGGDLSAVRRSVATTAQHFSLTLGHADA